MLSYALTFLVLAIIAGVLGASGVAAMATNFVRIVRRGADPVPRQHAQRTPNARAVEQQLPQPVWADPAFRPFRRRDKAPHDANCIL